MILLLVATLLAAADLKPPVIEHTPTKSATKGVELLIVAKITDPSGIFGASLYWKSAGEAKFNVAELTKEGGKYSAAIPGSKIASDIEYYLEAYDEHGNGPAQMGTPDAPLHVTAIDPPALAAAPAPSAPAGATEHAVAPAALEPVEQGLPIGPIALAGTGAALLIGGAVAWFSASGTIADIDAKYPTQGSGRLPADLEATKSAVSTSRIGSALMITGVAALAGGTAWFFVAPRPASGESTVGLEGTF